jgi:hypothetical protein
MPIRHLCGVRGAGSGSPNRIRQIVGKFGESSLRSVSIPRQEGHDLVHPFTLDDDSRLLQDARSNGRPASQAQRS